MKMRVLKNTSMLTPTASFFGFKTHIAMTEERIITGCSYIWRKK